MRRVQYVALVFICALAIADPVRATAFNSVYNASSGKFPDQVCPPWTLADTATPEDPVLSGGVLVIATDQSAEDLVYRFQDNVAIPDPLVIEARMKLVSGSSTHASRTPASIGFTTASRVGNHLFIGVDEVFLAVGDLDKGPTAAVVTNDAFHTYRIEVTAAGVITVFQDGIQILTGATFFSTTFSDPFPNIKFGETSGLASGTSHWEFVRHNASTVNCTDHFLCYKAKLTGGDICSPNAPSNAGGSCETESDCGGIEDDSFCVPNKFPKGVKVSLNDQFEDKDFDVKKPVNLCTPADKEGGGIEDADTHLKGYQIKEVKTSCASGPNQNRACTVEEDCGGSTGSTTFCQATPKHAKQTNVKVRNQFHLEGSELVVDTIKPDRLLVPTAKDLNNPVDPPDNDAHNVDHYKCYTVKVTPGTPKFEPILGVEVKDQFIEEQPPGNLNPKLFDLKKPTRLCTPVEKTRLPGGTPEPIKNDAAHLMCYQAKPAEGQPKHVKVLGIHVNNQFGPEQLDTVKEEEFCVPSAKIVGGGG